MTINVFGGGSSSAPVFPVQRSVRLRGSASANFSFSASAANRSQWTWSGWIKRGALGGGNIFGAGVSTNYFFIGFNSSDQLRIVDVQSSAVQFDGLSTAVFRDPSSWYHIVVVMDTAQGTAAHRLKVWVNNVLYSLSQYPGSGGTPVMNAATTNYIGNIPSVIGGIDGYITETYFVNAQALTPTSFGSYNSTTGVWQPIKYSGTYGTNGFYLNFQDNSAATAAAIGKDSSGNGNNWTPNNISVTAGVTYDSMVDVPTLTSATNANFATFNRLIYDSLTQTITNGNLQAALGDVSNGRLNWLTIPMKTGKWYVEFTTTSFNSSMQVVGIISEANTITNRNFGNTYIGDKAGEWSYGKTTTTQRYSNGVLAATGTTIPTNNDIISLAFDADAGTLEVRLNDVLQTISGFTGIPAGTYFFGCATAGASWIVNAGQRPFSYTPPTGFKSLNTFNLPDSTIPSGADYFAATTYTGTGSSLAISNTVNGKSFTPDFVWVKGRSGATDHALYDSVRGTTKQLESNATAAETTEATGLTAFGSSGFTVGALAQMNTNAATYIGWQWKAGGAAVTNTSGSISSQVSANPSAGFSIVTYTGTASAGSTVGHGLNIKPSLIIVKQRTTASTTAWAVYHSALDSGDSTNSSYLVLNTTAAKSDVTTGDAETVFGNGTVWKSPTSSVFTIGANSQVNASSGTYVAYCFSEIAGFSKFGSYTGNNSATDGTFVYLGFRPRFLIIKSTSAGTSWVMVDSSRNTYNLSDTSLYSESANSESTIGTVNDIDFLSNGFKLRNNTGFVNASQTYIYAAFAENPFKNALAR